MRKVPKQFKETAAEAWLDGYDTAMREPLHHCEHCGFTKEKVYRRGGTSWCKMCLEALE